MDYAKGDRVVTTRWVGNIPTGSPGVVIRVDRRWFSETAYTVLLDQDQGQGQGTILEGLHERDLFSPGPDAPLAR